MKRSALLVFLAVLVPFALRAEGDSEKESVDDKDVVVIELASAAREYGEALPFLIERFEAENPNIRVDWMKLPGVPNEQHTIYVTNFAARSEKPDVITMDVVWPGEFIENEWALPIDKYVTPRDMEGFLPGMLNPARKNGKLYGLPLTIGALQFYYRSDLLDKYDKPVPATLEEMAETARFIVSREGDPELSGYMSMWAPIEGLFMNYLQFLWAAGGQIYDSRGRMRIDTPEGRKALQFMVDMIEDGVAAESIVVARPNDAMALYGQGRAVFMVVQEYVWPILNQDDSNVKGKVSIARIPYFDGNPDAMTSCAGGWILGINPNSDHPDEAAELIKFLTSRESALQMAEKTGAMPARADLAGSRELIDVLPVAEYFSINHSVSDVRPSAQAGARYPELSHIMQKEIHAALMGKKSASEALTAAQGQIDSLMAE